MQAGAPLVAALLVAGCACKGGQKPPAGAGDGFDRARLLAQAADCAIGRYAAFAAAARELESKTRAFSASRGATERAAAQQSWAVAMAAWEEAELFTFGPAAASNQRGGRDLRDQIHAWPLVSRCRIDEQTVSRLYADPAYKTSLVNARGMTAVEYLLRYPGTDNGCAPSSVINASGTWAALSADELTQRKAEYAAAAAADVREKADALVQAWDPIGGNFRQELVSAGSGSKTFTSQQQALNAVSDAMFYLEIQVKDAKVGKPLGMGDCFQPSCPDALESQWAQASTAHLVANLIGFRRLYQGCSMTAGALGFDDWLVAAGAPDAAARLQQAIERAQAAVDVLTPPLEQALLQDPAKVQAVYAALKDVTDLLKTEFVSVLHLEPPAATEGDND
jgi:predicted lipoprotein